MKLGPYFTPYTKINSKWIKDLSVSKGIKPLEENRGVNLHNIGFGSDFLDITPKSPTKENIGKLDFIKIKNLCASKDTIRKVKRQP